MNRRIGFIVTSISILVIGLFIAPLTFAQIPWDYCKVSAYGNNVLEEVIGTIERISFNVAVPPSGSNITNTIEVMNYDSSENYTINPSIGDTVMIRYDFIAPDKLIVEPAAESNHFTIYYEGAVERVRVNAIDVPEFPPILIVPIFMKATLLALVYRRKKAS